jgi:hypothetical protein
VRRSQPRIGKTAYTIVVRFNGTNGGYLVVGDFNSDGIPDAAVPG